MKTRLVLAPLLLSVCSFAQDPVGSLEGAIRDISGGAIAGASVAITNLETGYKQTQVSSHEGLYKFSLAPIGRYQIAVGRDGFANFRQQPLQLNVSETVRLDVALAPVSQRESI